MVYFQQKNRAVAAKPPNGFRKPYALIYLWYVICRSQGAKNKQGIAPACHLLITFPASVLPSAHGRDDFLPKRCPDCRKMKARTPTGSIPAVRKATEAEIEAYREYQRMMMDKLWEGMKL